MNPTTLEIELPRQWRRNGWTVEQARQQSAKIAQKFEAEGHDAAALAREVEATYAALPGPQPSNQLRELFSAVESAISSGDPDARTTANTNLARAWQLVNGDRPGLVIADAETWLERDPPPPDQVLNDTFDLGDKVCIIGGSKRRKSFFVLQMALSLASGRDFLSLKTARAFRVLVVQLEVKPAHYHRRFRRMAEAMNLDAADLQGRLRFYNGRSINLSGERGIADLRAAALEFQAEVIVLDPLYKLLEGDENSAEDVKPVLAAFDELATSTGAAVAYCHHDPKGDATSTRDIRDRGAGSNVLGRDYDACFALSPHEAGQDATVVEPLLRNYAPQEPASIRWTDQGLFETANDLPAVKRSSNKAKGRQANGPPLDAYGAAVLDAVAKAPLSYGLLVENLMAMGLPEKRAKLVIQHCKHNGVIDCTGRLNAFQGQNMYGLPEAIEQLKRPKLKGV